MYMYIYRDEFIIQLNGAIECKRIVKKLLS